MPRSGRIEVDSGDDNHDDVAAGRRAKTATSPNNFLEPAPESSPSPSSNNSSKFTLVVVISSLVFVAIFGGALVGGIVSGDPDDAFYTVILVCSLLAIVCAASAVAYNMHRKRQQHQSLEGKGSDLRNTFTRSADEEYGEDEEYYHRHQPQGRTAANTPVQERIQEIRAGTKSVFGEISALSPRTYEVQTRYAGGSDPSVSGAPSGRRRYFGFASVASRTERSGPVIQVEPTRRGEDPPDFTEADRMMRESYSLDPPSESADRYMANDDEPKVEEMTVISESSNEEKTEKKDTSDDIDLEAPPVTAEETKQVPKKASKVSGQARSLLQRN